MINYEKYNIGLTKLKALENGQIIGVKGKPMKPRVSSRGYHEVSFYLGRRYGDPYKVQLLVHRLVAQQFLGKSKLLVNHKDGNKTNNHISNLEYVTHVENARHPIRFKKYLRGENCPRSKLSNEDVEQVKFLLSHNFSYLKIGRMFNVTEDCIGQISRGTNRITC